MAVNFYNNAEGGSDGLAVTTGNSGGGSGTAFSTVVLNGGTINFSSTQDYEGKLSYAINPPSATATYLTYSVSVVGVITARFYTYFTAVPTAAFQLTRFTSSGMTMGNLLFGTSGRFSSQVNGTTMGTGLITAPLNTWLRVEISVRAETGAGANGLLSNTVFTGNDVTNPIYQYVNTTALTGFNDAITFGIGKISAAGDWGLAYFDAITVQDVPALGPQAFTAPISWLGA